jgi:hypothetical protein
MILVGTDDGLHELEGDTFLQGHAVSGLQHSPDGWWAILDGQTVVHIGDEGSATFEWLNPRCLLPTEEGLLVGGPEAKLWRNGEPVASFQEIEGRDGWYTPWGDPPDTRSIARTADGTLHVNVHVGGIPRSRDGGKTWEPTIDVDADVHQVIAHPTDPSLVLAACASGLAVSRTGGDTYEIVDRGLHATYSRAVAIAGDMALFTVSEGHRGGRSGVYRLSLAGISPERSTDGLPEWFEDNIDTGCLAAADTVAAFGTTDGELYVSEDGGRSWTQAAQGLAPVRAVAIG